LENQLRELAKRHSIIGDIRGRGLLQGIELVKDQITRQPANQEGQRIGRICMENGLIFSLRRQGSVLRFVPPFTTTQDQLDLAADILDHAFREVLGTSSDRLSYDTMVPS